MEYYIANNFNYPYCNKKELCVINNNLPLLNCENIFDFNKAIKNFTNKN